MSYGDQAMTEQSCRGDSRNPSVATKFDHVESGERVTISCCPGASGSTVSTSKVGVGLVVEGGGAVVGVAVVLGDGTVVVTAGG